MAPGEQFQGQGNHTCESEGVTVMLIVFGNLLKVIVSCYFYAECFSINHTDLDSQINGIRSNFEVDIIATHSFIMMMSSYKES